MIYVGLPSALGTALIAVAATAGFAPFVSWISSVVILDLCSSVSLYSERPNIYLLTFVISAHAAAFFL